MNPPPSTSTPTAQATPHRPWLGLAHFTAADRDYFYGRDAEIRELTDRVRRAPLTVLYGLSGYGKSSLLGAGLIPALASAGHTVTLLRRCYDDLPTRPIANDIIAAVRADWGETGDDSPQAEDGPAAEASLTLWEFYHDRRRPWFQNAEEAEDPADRPPVLIFDQFEEIFIKGEDHSSSDPAFDARARQAARDFRTQLADLVENRPPAALRHQLEIGTAAEKRALLRRYDFQARPVRVAVALRDDFLGRLERWRRDMPSLMEHRIELRLLSGPQAFRAVFEPGTKRPGSPPIIPAPVAEAIVCSAAGAAPGTPLDEIDAVPPILSLLCERLNDRRLAHPIPQDAIQETDFTPGEATRILGAFYEDKLQPHPKALRDYLEDELVSDSGFRENVTLHSALAALRNRARLSDAEARLRQLVDDRILVIEDRGGIARVEFTHDTLAKLALERRALRQARARRRRAIAWTTVSLVIAGVALGLAGWALKERASAELALARAVTAEKQMEKDKAAVVIELERSRIEEGRAWLERARLAWEGEKNPLKALLLAGRAVGFHGFGREAEEYSILADRYPDLLGAPMTDPANETARQQEFRNVMNYAAGISPTGLPSWSSPIRPHHRGPVATVAFSPDGSTIATASDDRTIKLWDVASGKELTTLHGHSSYVTTVTFSPNGSCIASGSDDNTVKLWEVATGEELASLRGHEDRVTSVAFSRNGTLLASGSADKTIKLWDLATDKVLASFRGHEDEVHRTTFSNFRSRLANEGDIPTLKGQQQSVTRMASNRNGSRLPIVQELSVFEGHLSSVTSLAFSPDSSRLASGSTDNTVKLWDVASRKNLTSLEEHQRGVTSVAFDPDGSRLASGSDDKTIKLWNLATGKALATFQGHAERVTSVAFSPDGSRLASSSDDTSIKLWDLVTSDEVTSLKGHEDEVLSVAFSPDGTHIASGSGDRTVKLWDLAAGKKNASTVGHLGVVTSIAFSPDGSHLASGSLDKTVKLWNMATGQEIAALKGHEDAVTTVAFSPDGTRVASGSGDRTVKLWNVATGKELASLQDHGGDVNSVVFSPNGLLLASGSDDSIINVWDLTTGRKLASFQGHESKVTSLAFSPDGSRLASSSRDSTIKIWDLATGRKIASLPGHAGGVTSVAFSPDGTSLASGSWDRTIKLWHVTTCEEVTSLRGHAEPITSVAFSPDGTRLASGSDDTTVKLWDLETGKELASLKGHSSEVTSVAFSPDSSRLASCSSDNTIKLWDVSASRSLTSLKEHAGDITSVAFNPKGSLLASGSFDNTVKLWDVATGQELAHLEGHDEWVTSVAFSPNGSRLASGSADKTIKLWDVATGKQLAPLTGHLDWVTSVAFSPDSTRLASGAEDHTLKLWDIATGREVATFKGHVSPITSVMFSPDGTRLASTSGDGNVKLWDLATGEEIAQKSDFPLPDPKISPDGSVTAKINGKAIFLVPATGTLPLPQLERSGYLTLEGREPVWKTNDSLFISRSFEPLHWRQDLLAQLAEPDHSRSHHLLLRLRLCGQNRAWRVLPTLWREVESAGLANHPNLRREFARQILIAARALAVEEKTEFPAQLWQPLPELLDAAALTDPTSLLCLMQALPAFLRDRPVDDSLMPTLLLTVATHAPQTWTEALVKDLSSNSASEASTGLTRHHAFLRAAAERHPTSALILRAAIGAHDSTDAEKVTLEDRLLAHPSATAEDFISAAYGAAIRGESDRAKTLLAKAKQRFPTNERFYRLAGWCYLNLQDPAAALVSFEAARAALKPEEKPGTGLLAGLSLALWLNQKQDDAIATYKQLIKSGRTQEKPTDWADPKTIADLGWPKAETVPLEALRAATLKRYPELVPAEPKPD